MLASRPNASPPKPPGEPTWEIARLFPEQGSWGEEEYLGMNTNCLLEFSHGYLEVLPMPTDSHQAMVAFLFKLLEAFAESKGLGKVRFAPLRVRLWDGKYREPDLVFLLAEHAARRGEKFWDSADLVMEIVSDDDRRRDVEIKRFEYAKAGIAEYWIVDPQQNQITVLRLDGGRYVEHALADKATKATSALLPGFSVEVTDVFKAE